LILIGRRKSCDPFFKIAEKDIFTFCYTGYPWIIAALVFTVSTIRGPENRGKPQIMREKNKVLA
jgi:hypothetical protein